MPSTLLRPHAGLDSVRRWRFPRLVSSESLSKAEAATLFACGAAAAMVALAEFKLRLPGHSILRAAFPMVLGLSLVPRHGAGSIMGLGAVATTGVLQMFNLGDRGFGSMASLFLVGPCLDLALRTVRNGFSVYLALIATGVGVNLAAMIVQAVAKSAGWDAGGGKSVAAWFPFAALTYPLSGGIAGLLSACAWFRWKAPPSGA